MGLSGGIYFLHSSFIIQFIEDELADRDTNTRKLFRELIFSKTINATCRLITTDLITCNRTVGEINNTHGEVIKSSGAYFDLIEEKSIKEVVADPDLYSIKVLNNNRIATVGAFFICSDEKQSTISTLASTSGYTFKVLSPSNFPFE